MAASSSAWVSTTPWLPVANSRCASPSTASSTGPAPAPRCRPRSRAWSRKPRPRLEPWLQPVADVVTSAARPPVKPTGADPSWPDDAIEVGRIVDAWGLKGWIKVQPFASDPQALFSSRRWFIKPPEEGAVKRPVATTTATAAAFPTFLKVTEAKNHGDVVVALAQDVADRDHAEALRGARVFVA